MPPAPTCHERFLRWKDWNKLRGFADIARFKDVVNPVDGVVYPLICADIPGQFIAPVIAATTRVVGQPILPKLIFMRQSPEGVHVPHQAHTDMVHGTHSLMLYMNRAEEIPEGSGTSFLRHKELGTASNPDDLVEQAIWARDTNRPEKWEIDSLSEAAPNRACIFPADLYHRAEPIAGFGHDNQARLVLTMFFDV